MLRRKDDPDRTDPNAPTTMFEIAKTSIALDEPGGRFSASAHVVGTAPTVDYPAASGPWAGHDAVGPEPPTGEDISRVEPVGEPHELTASAAEREQEFWDLYNMITLVMDDFPDQIPDHIRELEALRPQIEADAAMLAQPHSVADAIAAWRRATRGIELMSKYHPSPEARAKLRAELRRGNEAMRVASRGRITR